MNLSDCCRLDWRESVHESRPDQGHDAYHVQVRTCPDGSHEGRLIAMGQVVAYAEGDGYHDVRRLLDVEKHRLLMESDVVVCDAITMCFPLRARCDFLEFGFSRN